MVEGYVEGSGPPKNAETSSLKFWYFFVVVAVVALLEIFAVLIEFDFDFC